MERIPASKRKSWRAFQLQIFVAWRKLDLKCTVLPCCSIAVLINATPARGFSRMARHIQHAVRRPLLFYATLMLILDPPGAPRGPLIWCSLGLPDEALDLRPPGASRFGAPWCPHGVGTPCTWVPRDIGCGNPGSGPWVLPFPYYSEDLMSVNFTQPPSSMLRSAAGWTVV